MPSTPARRGPHKVWAGYKNLRVPIEIYEEIREFMELRKEAYLNDDHPIDSFAGIREMLQLLLEKLESIERNQPKTQGTVKERIFELLKSNPRTMYSTVEISEILGIPKGTARGASRKVYIEHPEIEIIEGRPNRYYYTEDIG